MVLAIVLVSVTKIVATLMVFGKQTAAGLVAEICGFTQAGLYKPKSIVKLVLAEPSSTVGAPLSVSVTRLLMTIVPI